MASMDQMACFLNSSATRFFVSMLRVHAGKKQSSLSPPTVPASEMILIVC